MNKSAKKYVSVGLAATLCCLVCGCAQTPETSTETGHSWEIVSPDGSIVAAMQLGEDGKLYYSVNKGEIKVVQKSEMGIDVEEDDFNSATLCSVNSRRVSGEYENISGKRKNVTYDCNETTITLKGWSFYFDVTMRCYDDGYAFRYGVRKIGGGEGEMTVRDEKTQFTLPDKTIMWAQEYKSTNATGNFFAYELTYNRRDSETLTPYQYLAMPVLYRVNGTDTYSMIAQSELIGSGFYGAFLKIPEGQEGSGVLKTEHTPAGAAFYDEKVSYPFESPWRLGITGNLKTVEESELVEKLYDDTEYWKPDDYETLSDEEKEIYNYDWVEPGACAWSWIYYRNGEQSDYNPDSTHYQYLELAAEMGWKYILLDGGWNANLDETKFKAFSDYAREKGIKIIVWYDSLTSFGKGDVDVLRAVLDKTVELGISGIKPDFFDGLYAGEVPHKGEDIDHVKWYETIYQECAKRKLVVDCHGCNVPTGERRKYPNAFNREAVFGNETPTVGAQSTINQLLIRGVVGPTDFTPLVVPVNAALLTNAHQLALSFLFESGMPMYGDRITAYSGMVKDFYKSLPALRDETVFLDGSPSQLYSAAIRAGEQWFVGSVCYFETDVTIDFSFLGDGEYTAEIFTDGDAGLKREKITVTKNDKKSFSLIDHGGVVIRLVPKN